VGDRCRDQGRHRPAEGLGAGLIEVIAFGEVAQAKAWKGRADDPETWMVSFEP
jgi:hypothetical protein